MDKPKEDNIPTVSQSRTHHEVGATKPQASSEKNVEKGLSSLKAAAKLKAENPVENKLASKMPSRVPKSEEEDIYKKIKIPTSSDVHAQSLVPEKKQTETAKGNLQEQNKGLKVTSPVKQDNSIFGGKSEISRRELEYQLRKNPKVWQAQRKAGLTLSPAERAKLVKDIPQVYGGNISKLDIQRFIGGLNKRLLNTTDPQKHAEIRKTINTWKKIK